MLLILKRRKVQEKTADFAEKYVEVIRTYVQENYVAPPPSSGIQFSLSPAEPATTAELQVQYSERTSSGSEQLETLLAKQNQDSYDASEVARVLRKSSETRDIVPLMAKLEKNVNPTFVDKMLYHILVKGKRDSEVYKAAQVDKRLFSKMISNREYSPSKDTVVALAMALKLTLEEADDLLSRAGYTLSHSNRRDIIIEFFFREEIYNLVEANAILMRLNQKIIGR